MEIPRRPNVEREMGASDESIRKWIESSKKAEAKLDFNSKFKEMNGHVVAKRPFRPSLVKMWQLASCQRLFGYKTLVCIR